MTNEASTTERAVPMRDRLIECASDLFYSEGIRAISADRIIAGVGTTKATFYRHFPTKDDLVMAYLERRADWERIALTTAAQDEDPRRVLKAISVLLADSSCQPGFRGCPFINAGAEYVEVTHPVRRLVDEQRNWWWTYFRALAIRLGTTRGKPADAVADQLLMLRDGALIAGYLGDASRVEAALSTAMNAVVAAAT
ncbi:TetR/AcrR family transcriptional regulator [Kribbella sp. NPDC056861]|uniref:TetR/AcrR family transcriptional regulator n=1 Tax=Kribbella sp. NPDC056861 TaxID=3154857 RepID=UPI003416FA2C